MSQYHYLVNLDKKELVNPHRLGNGLKLREQAFSQYGMHQAVMVLLAASNKGGPRGGGDFGIRGEFNEHKDLHNVVGSWAGDRVAWVGDYYEPNDIPEYDEIDLDEYSDISDRVAFAVEVLFDLEFTGDGWRGIALKKRHLQ